MSDSAEIVAKMNKQIEQRKARPKKYYDSHRQVILAKN